MSYRCGHILTEYIMHNIQSQISLTHPTVERLMFFCVGYVGWRVMGVTSDGSDPGLT